MQERPVNAQQLSVLRWIGDGCPDGVMADSSFKTSVVALGNRGLATISTAAGTRPLRTLVVITLITGGIQALPVQSPAVHGGPGRHGPALLSQSPTRLTYRLQRSQRGPQTTAIQAPRRRSASLSCPVDCPRLIRSSLKQETETASRCQRPSYPAPSVLCLSTEKLTTSIIEKLTTPSLSTSAVS